MYFHANVRGKGIYKDQIQMTYRATSEDGIHFKAMKDQLAPFYLRVFPYAGYYYGIAKNENKDGMLVRSNWEWHYLNVGLNLCQVGAIVVF